jgi:hypothetical protein
MVIPRDAGGPQDENHDNVVPFPLTKRPMPLQCLEEKADHQDNCEELRKSIQKTCAGLRGKKMLQCYAAAEESYKQCMEEQ